MWGDTKKPATMYPSTSGCFSFLNTSVTTPATIRMRAKSLTRVGISIISIFVTSGYLTYLDDGLHSLFHHLDAYKLVGAVEIDTSGKDVGTG